MKEIYFSEDQLKNLQNIGQQLFSDENDPRSFSYRRELIRPKIRWWRIALHCAVPLLLAALLFVLLSHLGLTVGWTVLVCAAALTVYILLRLKRILICMVRIYQRYAPEAVRNKCRFEPSCSQYMILCLEKYGAVKGLVKSIDRLKRCNINSGGFDFP